MSRASSRYQQKGEDVGDFLESLRLLFAQAKHTGELAGEVDSMVATESAQCKAAMLRMTLPGMERGTRGYSVVS